MNVGDKVRFLDSVGGGIHFSHCGEIPDGDDSAESVPCVAL